MDNTVCRKCAYWLSSDECGCVSFCTRDREENKRLQAEVNEMKEKIEFLKKFAPTAVCTDGTEYSDRIRKGLFKGTALDYVLMRATKHQRDPAYGSTKDRAQANHLRKLVRNEIQEKANLQAKLEKAEVVIKFMENVTAFSVNNKSASTDEEDLYQHCIDYFKEKKAEYETEESVARMNEHVLAGQAKLGESDITGNSKAGMVYSIQTGTGEYDPLNEKSGDDVIGYIKDIVEYKEKDEADG